MRAPVLLQFVVDLAGAGARGTAVAAAAAAIAAVATVASDGGRRRDLRWAVGKEINCLIQMLKKLYFS